MGYRPWGRPEQDTTGRPSSHRWRSAVHAHRVSSTRSGCRLAERVPLAWLPDHLLLHWKATALRGPSRAGALSPLHTLTVGGGGQRGSTQQQLRVTHLWRLHEVGHVPQPVPQLLNLGHGDPLELGDDRDLGVRVLLLVAFFGEEGPPGEDRRAAWCVPGPLPAASWLPARGSGAPPGLPHKTPCLGRSSGHASEGQGPCWAPLGLGTPTITSFTSQHPRLPCLDRLPPQRRPQPSSSWWSLLGSSVLQLSRASGTTSCPAEGPGVGRGSILLGTGVQHRAGKKAQERMQGGT